MLAIPKLRHDPCGNQRGQFLFQKQRPRADHDHRGHGLQPDDRGVPNGADSGIGAESDTLAYGEPIAKSHAETFTESDAKSDAEALAQSDAESEQITLAESVTLAEPQPEPGAQPKFYAISDALGFSAVVGRAHFPSRH